MSKPPNASRELTYPMPLKLTPALHEKVKAAAIQTGLKQSDVLRMSLERGVDVLLAQLKGHLSN